MIKAKEAIRQAASIAEVISTYTSVRGNKAICPFHSDTHPSLSISETKGLWHCFVCGVGGDTFTFVMKVEGVSFLEAVKILCDRYGITYTYSSPQEASEAKRRIALQKSEIHELRQIREAETANLNAHDLFLGGLWKRIYRSNFARREQILEIIEECFMCLEENYKQLERRYQDESGKVYRKALQQSGGRGGVSQI